MLRKNDTHRLSVAATGVFNFMHIACGTWNDCHSERERGIRVKEAGLPRPDPSLSLGMTSIIHNGVAAVNNQVLNGTTFGPYVIDSMIGSGGMGAVYRARDPRLRRDVAIKIIQPEHCDSDVRRRRFETEARSAARLAHPNVVAIYDVGEQDGTPYIVTELVEGGTLGERLRRRPMTPGEVLQVAIPVAEALADAHQRGIVHRDLKPENILLTPAGAPKISDFGLAKCLEPVDPVTSNAATAAGTMTREGTIVGTPAYMSPEQAAGLPVDFRSDLFSFGAILVEMMTGRRPFERSTHVQTLSAILQEDVDYRQIGRSMPAPLVAVVKRCLHKDPHDRFGSTSDLVHDLRRCTDPSAAGKQKWPLIPAFAVAAAIALAGAIMFLRPHVTPAAAPNAKIESLAILPLQNFSPDRAQDYFADAMTEELTSELASLHSLRVTSRTSASTYRGTNKPLPVVARELNVDAVIEGSVIRTGDRARITVQLIDGRTDRHVWAHAFERRGADVLALQRDVAAEIVDQIRVTLSPAERERLSRLPTHNVEAYQAFLRSTYKATTADDNEGEADEAIRYAERAVTLDPDFAEAWVALAHACQAKMFSWNGGKEYDEKAFVAVERALSLNPSLAAAYVTRGGLQYNRWHRYDIGAAIRDYRRALTLNPNLPEAHHSMCSELNHLGLHDEAIVECSTALRLDPQITGPKFRLGRAQWQSNRFADAVATYDRFDISNFEKVVTLGYLGRFDEARRALDAASSRTSAGYSGRPEFADLAAADALLSSLQHDNARAAEQARRSAEMGKRNPHFHHAAVLLAAAAAESQHAGEAVRWLTLAADTGMPNYPLFSNNPSLHKLAGNAAYDGFMRSLQTRWDQIVAQAK